MYPDALSMSHFENLIAGDAKNKTVLSARLINSLITELIRGQRFCEDIFFNVFLLCILLLLRQLSDNYGWERGVLIRNCQLEGVGGQNATLRDSLVLLCHYWGLGLI